ncbi:hypothetical protein F2P56_023938 [Juglans regia]|uniref:GTPase HflX N-terminal domain-containing protein n=2 Tax=Juglans regia TaxID=51240 RepID=A0A833T7L0_JUGRE|nr:putative pentatricopeptide repeat-containing protein At3g16710, mitochondrial isoform X2 [Juglans regia]KAF5454261.1 hypothetical protein F2P56_023938 [Juglans regia]
MARADTYFGPGTVETIKCSLYGAESEGEVDAVFVNTVLSRVQQRNLERAWDKPVLDRVGLIIEIFNGHAFIKEAKLQAELTFKKTSLVHVHGLDGRYTFGATEEAEVVSACGRGSGGHGVISGAGETELQLQRRSLFATVDPRLRSVILPSVAVKLSPLAISKRIPNRVNLNAFFSSVSCANGIDIFPVNNQNLPTSSDFELNVQFLRNKISPDNLIRVLDNTSDVNSAMRLFKWATLQKPFSHTADTYYQIILKLGMAGNVKEMEELCQNMVKDRCPGFEEALVALVGTFVRHCRLNEAVRVVLNMNFGGHKPVIDAFNAVLGALVEGKRDFHDVMFVYKEMVKAGMVPTIDTLNCLLEALFEANKIESALDQFRRMNKKGCNPNVRTFEIVIKGLVEKGRVDEAVIVLGEMFELSCQPDLSFYSCTIPLFCRENKPEEGIRLFRLMRASKFVPDSFICEALMQCLCENLGLDDAMIISKELIESDINLSANVLVDMINGFCKLGKINEAIKFLEGKYAFETSPHNALLEGCCNAGKFSVAKGLIEKMSERNIANCDSWNILIRWLSENAGIGKVYEILGKMVVSSCVPDCTTYLALVIGNCRWNKYDDALKLFNEIRAKCWVLDSVSYSKLVEGLCRVERTLEATEVFCYMSGKRCSLQSSSFDVLIKGICSTGKVSQAIKLRQMAYYSGTPCNTATHSAIMLKLFKLGKAKDVLVALSQMLVEGCSLDLEVYSTLIQSMSSLNQIKYCVFFFNMMVNEGLVPDSDCLFDLLLCMANHSQLCMVSSAIDKLISKFAILNPEIYNMLINGFLKEGNQHEACRLLDLMLEKGWVPDASTHGLLIGSVIREETEKGAFAYDNSSVQDTVSNILAEGLGQM